MEFMRIPRNMVLPFSFVIGGCLAGCHQRKAPPSIDGVAAALERTAGQALAAPSLADDEVLIPVSHGGAEAQAAQVLAAATAAGGAAIRSPDEGGRMRILATIPENNAVAFKAALRHESEPMEKPSSSTRLIEVVLQSQTGPSPTP